MSTNGVTLQEKPSRKLDEWGIVTGQGSGRSFLVNLHGDAIDFALFGEEPAEPRINGRPADEFPNLAQRHLAVYLLGRPCFFRDAYLYQETIALGPGSDIARGHITGVGISRVVLPLGLYGKSVGISLIPSEITLCELMPIAVLDSLDQQIDSCDEMNSNVSRGAPRIQLAHGSVPRS
jgi:hypothetical protein